MANTLNINKFQLPEQKLRILDSFIMMKPLFILTTQIMVNQKGVNIRHPSKGRPSRDLDLGRLKSIGPRQMRWYDFL